MSLCSLPYFDTLISLAPENGFIHAAHAIQLYKDGDLDGALEALSVASLSAQVDSYYWDYLKAIDESLSRQQIERTVSSLEHTFGVVSAMPGAEYMIFDEMCSNNFRDNLKDWSRTCYAAANNMAEKSKNSLNHFST